MMRTASWRLNLHQLRHSALKHLAALGHYVRLGEATFARITAALPADSGMRRATRSMFKEEI